MDVFVNSVGRHAKLYSPQVKSLLYSVRAYAVKTPVPPYIQMRSLVLHPFVLYVHVSVPTCGWVSVSIATPGEARGSSASNPSDSSARLRAPGLEDLLPVALLVGTWSQDAPAFAQYLGCP